MPSCYTVSREELLNHLTRRLFSSPLLLPLLGKPFIEAEAGDVEGLIGAGLLPLLGKPFIEATRRPRPCARRRHCFPFWGSPSLRRSRGGQAHGPRCELLPLLGKPFIEAMGGSPGRAGSASNCFPFWGSPSLRPDGLFRLLVGDPHCFPFWGSPSLRRRLHARSRRARELLPLLGKPFIEA